MRRFYDLNDNSEVTQELLDWYNCELQCNYLFELFGEAHPPLNLIRRMIQAGLDVNSRNVRGETVAFYCKTPQEAQLLIELGADIFIQDKYGYSVLHACWNRELAEFWIAHGLSTDLQSYQGRTPLHTCHCAEVARALIDAGADLNARDFDGNTPLHYSSSLEIMMSPSESPLCYEVAEVLLEAGADVDAVNDEGLTPLFSLYCMGCSGFFDKYEMVVLFLRYNASVRIDGDAHDALYYEEQEWGDSLPAFELANCKLQNCETLMRRGCDYRDNAIPLADCSLPAQLPAPLYYRTSDDVDWDGESARVLAFYCGSHCVGFFIYQIVHSFMPLFQRFDFYFGHERRQFATPEEMETVECFLQDHSEPFKSIAYIDLFFVAPQYRHIGLGRRILEVGLEDAKRELKRSPTPKPVVLLRARAGEEPFEEAQKRLLKIYQQAGGQYLFGDSQMAVLGIALTYN